MAKPVLVFSEKPALLAELTGAGLDLGGEVLAAVIGPREAAEAALLHGARRALWMQAPQKDVLIEDYTLTLESLVRAYQPGLVLIGATRRGRVVAGRLAARLDTSALTDVLELQPEGEGFQIRHMVFGGGAVRVERLRAGTVVATAGPGIFSARPPHTEHNGEITPVTFIAPGRTAALRERKPRAGAVTNLAGAKRVVCSGRGVAKAEDLGMINELAQALHAEVGCTRPLAEGLNWLPRERYIGISGAQVRPDLYLGVGVSGQVQHMIGMSRSKLVVAINKDSHAPIFANADYGIVGDLYAVVPALLAELRKPR
jgi:electron transfer flavoprotein alpha subunit